MVVNESEILEVEPKIALKGGPGRPRTVQNGMWGMLKKQYHVKDKAKGRKTWRN